MIKMGKLWPRDGKYLAQEVLFQSHTLNLFILLLPIILEEEYYTKKI